MGAHANLYLLLDAGSCYTEHGRILMPETGNKETGLPRHARVWSAPLLHVVFKI